MAIFEHRDRDGDGLAVTSTEGGEKLLFQTDQDGCDLDREAAQRLHNALGEWLHPQNLGPAQYAVSAALAALTDAVNAAASAVRPLWQSPAAAKYVDARPSGEPCRGGWGCDDLGVHPAYGPLCGKPDPEPHDVGHPVQPTPEPLCNRTRPGDAHEASRCTFCGHLWEHHRWDNPLSNRGRLMSKLLKRSELLKPKCTCLHPTQEHAPPGPHFVGGCAQCICLWEGVPG